MLEVGPSVAVLHQHRYRAAGELQADYRGRFHDPALDRPQAVKAGPQQGRDGSRNRDDLGGTGEDPAPRLLTQQLVVDQHGEHLLDEQGVAFSEAEDPSPERSGQTRLAEKVPHHQAALLVGEVPELDLRRRPPSCGEARSVLVQPCPTGEGSGTLKQGVGRSR
jgi:hypothetical protein